MSDPSATPPQSGQTTGRFNQAEVTAAMQQAQPSAPQPAQIGGVSGMFQDASTLAATGLIAAVAFAVFAGVINFFADHGDFKGRLLAITDLVDVGDVALLGIATLLLLVTPDPPGGIERSLLLRITAVLAAAMTLYGGIQCFVIATEGTSFINQLARFLATIGWAIGSATVAFYAAKESFLKKEGLI